MGRIGRYEAEQQVRMAGKIFGARLDRQIDRHGVGRKEPKGVAQVLSMMTQPPRSRATADIAGHVLHVSDCDPGASTNMARVLARISAPILAPMAGS